MKKVAFLFLLLTFAASTVMTQHASAASRVCQQLEKDLVGKSGARFSADKYDAAIERQRDELAVANDQKEEAGCGFSVSGRRIRQCATITRVIEKMNRNLATLQRDRKRASATPPSKRQRTRILAALKANNCRDDGVEEERTAEPVSPPKFRKEALATPPKSPIQELLETKEDVAPNEPVDGFSGSRDESEDEDLRYRTMCVRTCDGYFFPMSNASTVSDFDRDQQNCETACPGTDIHVFYGPSDTDDPSKMMSTADGSLYGTLPTAFRHQNASLPRVPSCGCNASKDFEVTAGRSSPQSDPPGDSASLGTKVIEEEKSSSIVTIPAVEPPKPAPKQQLDTVGSSAGAVKRDAPERNVRVVGPEFLPDPKAAIDLRAPDQKTGP